MKLVLHRVLNSCGLAVLVLMPASGAGLSDARLAAIYNRTTNVFAAAAFFKPAMTNEENLVFKLAPLVFQEVSTNSRAFRDGFGAIAVKDRHWQVDSSKPTVYYDADNILVHGQLRARFTYVWFYPAENASTNCPPAVQGVSLTLGSAGKPAIWEVLADTSSNRVLFVSEGLEAAAISEFGKPLPGRRHAIERSPEQAPSAVVARAIDDGPVPMGPMVYLLKANKDATTVACRCMPPQARSLSSSAHCDLMPLKGSPAGICLEQIVRERQPGPGRWPNREGLEQVLRLPAKF